MTAEAFARGEAILMAVMLAGALIVAFLPLVEIHLGARRQCAWCGKHLGWARDGLPGEITHGICPKCEKEIDA